MHALIKFVSAILIVACLIPAGSIKPPVPSAQRRAGTATADAVYDLVIRNGRVVDGTGRRAFRADVAVRPSTPAAPCTGRATVVGKFYFFQSDEEA